MKNSHNLALSADDKNREAEEPVPQIAHYVYMHFSVVIKKFRLRYVIGYTPFKKAFDEHGIERLKEKTREEHSFSGK